MKGFTKDGKFRPTEKRTKSSLSKKELTMPKWFSDPKQRAVAEERLQEKIKIMQEHEREHPNEYVFKANKQSLDKKPEPLGANDYSRFQVRFYEERDNASIDVVEVDDDGDLDSSQKFVWSINDPQEIHELIEDGFIKNFYDEESVLDYLNSHGIIKAETMEEYDKRTALDFIRRYPNSGLDHLSASTDIEDIDRALAQLEKEGKIKESFDTKDRLHEFSQYNVTEKYKA